MHASARIRTIESAPPTTSPAAPATCATRVPLIEDPGGLSFPEDYVILLGERARLRGMFCTETESHHCPVSLTPVTGLALTLSEHKMTSRLQQLEVGCLREARGKPTAASLSRLASFRRTGHDRQCSGANDAVLEVLKYTSQGTVVHSGPRCIQEALHGVNELSVTVLRSTSVLPRLN